MCVGVGTQFVGTSEAYNGVKSVSEPFISEAGMS